MEDTTTTYRGEGQSNVLGSENIDTAVETTGGVPPTGQVLQRPKNTGSSKEQEIVQPTSTAPASVAFGKAPAPVDPVLKAIGDLTAIVTDVVSRISKIEDGGANEFKEGATDEAIKNTHRGENVDARIIEIVDKSLGQDFGIKVEGLKDSPALLFTIIVPQRLSGLEKAQRPIKTEKGDYATTEDGSKMMEDYHPVDERSRILSTSDSFDKVREHCDKVKANIVSYYQKMKQPIPAFDVKK